MSTATQHHATTLACERTLEAIEAQQALVNNKRPSLLQVQALMLDPAIAHEFEVLRKALESKSETAARLQDELQGAQDGNMSRVLVNKCRALQEENDRLKKELHGDSTVAALQRQLATAQAQITELQKQYAELKEHCLSLEERRR